jgi:hypothetical protein
MYCHDVSVMPAGQRAAVASRRESRGRRGTITIRTPAKPRSRGLAHRPDVSGVEPAVVVTRALHRTGLRGWQCHACSFGGIGLCIGLWIRAKTVDQEERGNAERRALFVGLWPPMLWLIGDALERCE